MGKWLKGCELCNAGLIAEIDRQLESGISINKLKFDVRIACQLMVKEIERRFKVSPYSVEALRKRYDYYRKSSISGGNLQSKSFQTNEPQAFATDEKSKNREIYRPKPALIQQEDVKPEPDELSVDHHIGTAKASAEAQKPKPSELENAARIVRKTAEILERIIEGDLKDNGSDDDKLFAESIKRHGPSIIISFYRLGIDPEKAIKFYKGETKDDKKLNFKDCKQGKEVFEKFKSENHSEVKTMPKAYTEEEKKFLRDNINQMSNKQLAEKLGRSEGALSVSLSNFGIKRDRQLRKPKPQNSPEKSEVYQKSSNQILKVDFSEYPYLLEKIVIAAKDEMRSIENQILYILKQNFDGNPK